MLNEPEYLTEVEPLRALVESLIVSWDGRSSGSWEFGQRDKPALASRFLSVFGMSAHVHRLAEAFLTLHDRNMTVEALPILRLMYESALTSMWLAQNDEGAAAFANAELGQRRNIAETLGKTNNRTFQQSALNFPGLDRERILTDSDQQAKKFYLLCNDLTPGGADAYVLYRLLCGYSHATLNIIDQYMIPNEQNDDVEGISYRSAKPDTGLWLYIAASSLVWAGTAVDYIDPRRERRSELRDAARSIGVPRDLHLTFEANQRIAASRRARRQSAKP